MQDRRLWYRGGLGRALALGVMGVSSSRTEVKAEPRTPLPVDQTMSSASSVFSAKESGSHVLSSSHSSQAPTHTKVDAQSSAPASSERGSSSSSSSS
ncbi:BspA family leucine-rich repeat surface protein, partial [Lactiplantibacillus pentosus]